jgi:hypothetical protein
VKSTHALGVFLGFLGGILGAVVLLGLANQGALRLPAAGATAPSQGIVAAHAFRLVDASGKTHAMLSLVDDDNPALFFFDHEGRNRMVIGLYAPAEGQFPFVVLNDTHQHAAGIFRLFGPQETPVVVLKNDGQDRSIYGLNPTSLAPFLVQIAPDGKRTDVFGHW